MKRLKLTISVYDFIDFREFLKAAYEDLHTQDGNFSYRYLQKHAGYSTSSNHFWQIIAGRATLSSNAAQRYSRAFGLSVRESQFFVTLAALNQARSDADRNALLRQLKEFAAFRNKKYQALLRWEYYSEWYYPALRELVALDNFREDYAWIAGELRPTITARQARDGVAKLLDWGYLVRDETKKLKQSEPFIGGYGNRQDSEPLAKLAVRNFHRTMIEMGGKSIDLHDQTSRYVVGATMAISRRQAQGLREMVEEFMGRVTDYFTEDDEIETVYRLNLQFFPLVRSEHVANLTLPTRQAEEKGEERDDATTH